MKRTRRRVAIALAYGSLALAGCGPNWQPVTAPGPRTYDPGQVIEFHVKEELVRLHGVQLSRDSVSGIPWLDHLSCDTCRVSYPLSATSNMRTGNPGAGAWWLFGPMLALVITSAGLAMAFSAMGGS